MLMYKSRFYLCFFVVAIVLYSCSGVDDYNTTESGLKYKFFIKNEDGLKPKANDIIVVDMMYKTENDSIIFDTKELIGAPFRMKLKAPHDKQGTIDEGLSMMRVGDSAQFLVDAEAFFIFTQGREVPSNIKPGEKLIFNIKLKEVFDLSQFRHQQREVKTMNAQDEERALNVYIKNAAIDVEPLVSGLYYIEEEQGKGRTPSKGQRVVVHYTGTFINGELFDSSYKRGEPFVFKYGVGEVIQGWDEGLSFMKEGGKAMLIIPSHLAYGDKQFQMIPPFSTLIFYIELIEIL